MVRFSCGELNPPIRKSTLAHTSWKSASSWHSIWPPSVIMSLLGRNSFTPNIRISQSIWSTKGANARTNGDRRLLMNATGARACIERIR
uniref:Uncharacterized protein n=1 Tax=Anopheles christyi TaxID=43041 RepID=A0A182KID3_9DIPT